MKLKSLALHIESVFSNHPVLAKYVTADNVVQFCRYVIVGLISFSLEYGLFCFLLQYLKWWYVLAHTLSLVPVFWLNFLLNRRWSFQSRDRLGRQLTIYGLLFLFNLFISDFLIYGLAGKLRVDPRWAKLMVMAFIVMWNFVLYKRVIYKR